VKRLLPLLVLLVVGVLACSPAPAPRPIATPVPAAPAFAPNGTARRVVLVSCDGMGAEQFRLQSNLPAFDRASQEGTRARIVPINPTATGPAHVSILTGTTPEKHGIVANRFHLAGTPPEQMTMGLGFDPDAETIVEAARRQGKRVGCVPFPTMDAQTPRRTCDFGIAWISGSLARPRVVRLQHGDFHREWVPPTWTQRPQRRQSFSPVMRARVEWSTDRVRADVDVVAYDETNDNVENYDAIAIEVDGTELNIAANGWFAISKRDGENLYGSWSKLIAVDDKLNDVELYWGGIQRNEGYPSNFLAAVNEIGFWPGSPEADATPEIFREQAERLAEFMTRVQTMATRRMPFDLLLLYRPELDNAGHQYLGANATVIRSAWESVDRAFAAIRDSLDLTRDALIVTGDHGFAPVDTEVRLGRLLADRGFAPRWRVFASGNVAQFYRFGEPDDTDALLKVLTDSGWFEKIDRKSAASHPHSGDIAAISKPNVALTASSDAPVSVRPQYHGAHGSLNTHPEMHTLFFASGAGVPNAVFGETAQTKIARYVSKLLGIQPPSSAE
jgi:predicted AlkP superfamily pyrophosphatase or phosphodiesterase